MSIIIDSKNPKNEEEKNIVNVIENTIDIFLNNLEEEK